MFPKNELPPVHTELQDSLAGDYPEIVQIAEYAANATPPMPAIPPEMAAIWSPLGQAQANIVGGSDPPESTMVSAGEEIVSQIGS